MVKRAEIAKYDSSLLDGWYGSGDFFFTCDQRLQKERRENKKTGKADIFQSFS